MTTAARAAHLPEGKCLLSISQSISQAITLRDYQTAAIEDIRAHIRAGKRRILLVAPTGSGKGSAAAYMIQSAAARGKRIGFLVNRRELVKDLSRRLDRLGLDHGIVMGDFGRNRPRLPVQVCSIDTLHRRDHIPEFDLAFLDEAHFSISPIWRSTVARLANTILIGMTATPLGPGGRGLGELYECMVECPQAAELIERGHLVQPRVFAPGAPDVSQVETASNGDYNQKQLAEICDRAALTGDIVQHWLRLGVGRPTIAFAVSCDHSRHIVERFTAAGVIAQHVDADTPDDVRDKLWADLASGRVQVVSSVGVISYGFDCPPVSCAILARPTKSEALYLQQVGRVLRTHPGKPDALILDHAGNTMQHGLPDEPRAWSLDAKKRRKKRESDRLLSVRLCKGCFFAYPSKEPKCPACGAVPEKKDLTPDQIDGDLQEVAARYVCSGCRRDLPDAKLQCEVCGGFPKRAYQIKKLSTNPVIAELQRKAEANNYAPGWVWHQMQALKQRGLIGMDPAVIAQADDWMAARLTGGTHAR